ncbi:MAG: UDP-N-acetylenolpyruvoylglucosamine reductase [Bacteroidetes bacterium]|nr:UDP-N-acetylenolpyruvoylglucosamine reductase [Bacteroidota bacterium]
MKSLKPCHTFQIDAQSEDIIEIQDNSQIEILIKEGIFQRKFLILGSGSNILFTQDFPGTVIIMNTKGIHKIAENSTYVYLKVSAGEEWDHFTQYCVDNQYYGIENLIGIPGKVGSSPVQNIGAYGVELKDTLFQVHAISLETGKKRIFTNEQCQFGYRDSIFKNEFKNRFIITDVIFELSKIRSFHLEYAALNSEIQKLDQPLTLSLLQETILRIRNSKLPDIKEVGSAGSFFKNPIIRKSQFETLKSEYPKLVSYPIDEEFVKLAAGQLIDICGWKGYREGDAGVYPLQALVLVNYGHATGKEIQVLFQKIQKSVFDRFGISIEPEVNIW